MPDEAPQPTKINPPLNPANFKSPPTPENFQLTNDQQEALGRLWEIHKRGLHPDKVIGDP